MNPTCPTDYSCTFTLTKPHVIVHTIGPWYQGTAGWIVALVAIIALTCLLGYIADLVKERRDERQSSLEHERERKQKLAIEEQRTMQIDAAKGNPEMLTIVKDMQRGYR